MLVVLIVFLVLIALLIPAVQSARESARKLSCMNNIKQLGLGINAYQNTFGSYPPINLPTKKYSEKHSYSVHYYSALVRILPQIDESNIYNSTNFSLVPSSPLSLRQNETVLIVSRSIFLCPTEARSSPPGYGRSSYRFNTGPSPWFSPSALDRSSFMGSFTTHVSYTPKNFSDGLSQTIALSERTQGDWIKGNRSFAGDYLLTFVSAPFQDPSYPQSSCRSVSQIAPLESRSGESWFFSGFHFTNYNHYNTPNFPDMDCSFDPSIEGLDSRVMHDGIFTARSSHGKGVNVGFMDGSVKFIGDSISREVWQAISTRNGREVIADFEY
jgi:prepilin-type processing-associated H-X9-DG protein